MKQKAKIFKKSKIQNQIEKGVGKLKGCRGGSTLASSATSLWLPKLPEPTAAPTGAY
jgi:hypothetical protein